MASDYLGCHEVITLIDFFVLEHKFTLEEAILVQKFFVHRPEWQPKRVTNLSLEFIKSNLHLLALESQSNDVIGQLSEVTLKDILSDRTLSYFTPEQRRLVVGKWVSFSSSQADRINREKMYYYIDEVGDACCNKCPNLKSRGSQTETRGSRTNASQYCQNHVRPVIIIAAATGRVPADPSERHTPSSYDGSKTIWVYNIEEDRWFRLPNIPVLIRKPLITANDCNAIYIVDSFGYRQVSNPTPQQHQMHILTFKDHGWAWTSWYIDIPLEFSSFHLQNIFYFEDNVYFFGIAKMNRQVMKEWDKGEVHRWNILTEQSAPCALGLDDVRLVVLLTFNLRNQKLELAKFVCHVGETDLNDEEIFFSCLVDDKICMELNGGYLIDGDPTESLRIFSVYDCRRTVVDYMLAPYAKLDYHQLVGIQGHHEVAQLALGSCCYRVYNMGKPCGVRVVNKAIPFPYSCFISTLQAAEGRSFMVVADRDNVYIIGGLSRGSNLNLCLCLQTNAHSRKPTWKNISPVPTSLTQGGIVLTHLTKRCLTHHEMCPHCRMYPTDIRKAQKNVF